MFVCIQHIWNSELSPEILIVRACSVVGSSSIAVAIGWATPARVAPAHFTVPLYM